MSVDVEALGERIREESSFARDLITEVGRVIVGQQHLVDRLIIGLLCNGHVLLEGVPGLAKTLTVKSLADAIHAEFKRIQFTPDLLPADLIGTMIYDQATASFTPKKGPVFANFVLADEINRAPAKVQSALLEAMQERQVTIGDTTFPLPDPFLVLATQNPIEQEGTYPLPEAQVDRFMFKVKVNYPDKREEREILDRMTATSTPSVNRVIQTESIAKAQAVMNEIHIADSVKNYIVDIVFASRDPEAYNIKDLKGLIAYGASPRATIFLTTAAKAHAFIRGRGYVTPEDVKSIGPDVLRHRVIVTYEAEAEEISSEDVVQKIFDNVEVP